MEIFQGQKFVWIQCFQEENIAMFAWIIKFKSLFSPYFHVREDEAYELTSQAQKSLATN